MAENTIFANLNSLLQSKAANTVDTPYNINITDMTDSNCLFSASSGTLGYILKQNPNKYVSLSFSGSSNFSKIGREAFYNCQTLLWIYIPDTITKIDKSAFKFCKNLGAGFYSYVQETTPFTIPSSVTSLGEQAFYYCNNLKYCDIETTSLTNIPRMCFYKAEKLQGITIPEGVITIEAQAFDDCTALSGITFSSTVKEVAQAFSNCSNITMVRFEQKYDTLKQFTTPSPNKVFPNSTIQSVGVEDTICENKIKNDLASDFNISSTATYTTENNVNEVSFDNFAEVLGYTGGDFKVTGLSQSNLIGGDRASQGTLQYVLQQNSSKSVSLYEDSTCYIDEITSMQKCFFFCENLRYFEGFPSTVTNLDWCFYHCSNLTFSPLSIPSNVTTMKRCFSDCYIMWGGPETIPNTVINMESCFQACEGMTSAVSLPEYVQNLSSCFKGCTRFNRDVSIPNTVTNMNETFSGCTSFDKDVTIPSGVTSLNETFKNCSSLKKTIVVPSLVTDLTSAFEGCTSLTEVTLQIPVEKVADGTVTMTNAFQNCSSLTKVNVPAITVNKTSTWNAWRIIPDSTNHQASVQCFDYQGNAKFLDSNQQPQDVIVPYGNSTDLIAKIETNLLSFANVTDKQIKKVMTGLYSFTKNNALDPDKESFVLWGKEDENTHKANFVTNLTLSGEVIDDSKTRQDRTWSSSKINNELGNKADETSIKQYIRNQNILAEQEVMTINNTNVTMHYDGYITIRGSTSQAFDLYVNDVLYARYAFSYGYYENTSITIPVKKGDKIRRSVSSWSETHARFYKLRDYTGR